MLSLLYGGYLNRVRYPIKADYVGLSLATTLQEYINVELKGTNKGVYLS